MINVKGVCGQNAQRITSNAVFTSLQNEYVQLNVDLLLPGLVLRVFTPASRNGAMPSQLGLTKRRMS